MQFGILGPLEVRTGDAIVDIRRGIPRTLLTALILRAGETLTTDAVAEILWGNDQPRNPGNALQVQISYLRRALGGAGPGGSQVIVTRAGGYSLEIGRGDIDAHRFESLVRDASRLAAGTSGAELAAALDRFDEALGLWRGDALADLAGSPFAVGDATRLHELRWESVEARNEVMLALGRHRELIGELSQLVRLHPLRERFHEQLMLSLYRSDRQADALRAYEQARTVLLEELGLDPGKRLKDLQVQVLAQDSSLAWVAPTGLAEPSPPPPPSRARPAQAIVPVPMTRIVGREVEIGRVQELLSHSRLVTLTGPAGAGKTRLAIEVARLEEDETDVLYVDLGALSQPDLVGSTVAAAAGVTVPPDEDAADLVADRLADHPSLLVLDTCEHVLPAAAALASRVVRRSATTRVLATSRRPLTVAGEIAWPVPPLAVAPPDPPDAGSIAGYPAIELFAERAGAVRPDFALTDGNAADVASICLALDGLPLAIELAAARADVLSPGAIRARLEDRFALLVDGSTDVAARQQTLRAAIDWSFDLLDPDQRRFLARLSVFPSTFDLDAAAAIAGADVGDPVALLSSLARNSVVMVAGPDRYQLLDSVRAYAAERLDDRDETCRLHAEHYARLAEESAPHLRGPEQVQWLDRLRDDIPQFRAAILWALEDGADELAARLVAALAWFWTVEGRLDEAMQIFDRALTLDAAPAGVRSRVLAGFGLLAASLGDLRRAREAGEAGVALARTAADAGALGDALNTTAVAQWALGDHPAAAASHDEAFVHYDAAGDPWGRAVALTLRARTAIDSGEGDASQRAAAALPVAHASGDRHIIGIALDQLARIRLNEGDLAAALEYADECVALHAAIGYTEGVVSSLHLLGRVRLAAGDEGASEALHRKALSLATAIGHAAATCEAVEDLARIAGARGEHGAVLRLLTVTDRERLDRTLPRRRPDDAELDELRAVAAAGLGEGVRAIEAEAERLALPDLVSELLTS